jgi:hypothetical protein
VLRASIAAEKAGFPAVSIVGELFVGQATAVAEAFGVEGEPLAVYPGRIKMDPEEDFQRKVATVITDQVVHGLTLASPQAAPPPAEPEPRAIILTGTVDEINDRFYDRGWTDGLPVVPPTIDRIEAFLEHTDRSATDVLGVLQPDRREATVWSVAVTGVMAGCRPEYMPVLIAAVEAIADPFFKVEDAGSGVGWETLIVVSGPVIQELDFNALAGVQRVGRRANTSVGRFLRIYIRNVAGMRIPPFDTDMAAIGDSFYVCMAENEELVRSLGWPTFGDDVGIPAGRSGVTVQSVAAASPPFNHHGGPYDDPFTYLEPVVDVYSKAILGYWLHCGLAWASWCPLVVVSPLLAKLLHEKGWTKDSLRDYLYENGRVPAKDVERRGEHVQLNIAEAVAKGSIPPDFHTSDDPDRLIPVFLTPESIRIIVTGHPNLHFQRGYMNNHAQGAAVTRVIADGRLHG